MLEAQAQVRAYQAAMNEFLACIDSELEGEGEQAPEEFKSLVVSRHNAAVAEMEGVAAAFEAIRRDEQSPYSYYALAITSVYAGESTQAIRAAQRALELTPSFALGYLVLGLSHLFAGEPRAAIQPTRRPITSTTRTRW